MHAEISDGDLHAQLSIITPSKFTSSDTINSRLFCPKFISGELAVVHIS